MRIVALADTHGFHHQVDVPDGDILIFTGDVTMRGNREELKDFAVWANALPHKHKIVIAGNHDFCIEKYPLDSVNILLPMRYLEDGGITLEGISFYGTPWTPKFGNWAFMREESELKEKFASIPQVDVLISHGPPLGIGDRTEMENENVGSMALGNVPPPRIHIFGHIHEGYGEYREYFQPTLYYNASIVDFHYNPVNKPFVIDW